MKQLLMGIDVGTTHIKAAAFTLSGVQEALTIVPNNVYYNENGFSFYDPIELKQAVFSAVSGIVKKLDAGDEILALSVTSMAEAGVPIDDKGNPLYHIITWFDKRTMSQMKWWEENINPYEIYRETGQILQPKYSINKIMWIRENEELVYNKTAHWLCMEDYIIFCLSGAVATDFSIAGRTMALNLQEGEWSNKILDMSEINKNILPEILPSGTIAGRVTGEAARETLLKQGMPVVTGGHDHLCAALALGVLKEGDVFNSMGTAEALVAVTGKMDLNVDKFSSGLNMGRFVTEDKFYVMGGIQNSGGSIEWFGRNLMEKSGVELYTCLGEIRESMEKGPTGIFYIPHLSGAGVPNIDPLARGAFIGLTAHHTKGDIIKSIYEGVSYEMRVLMDSLKNLTGFKAAHFRVAGGSTKNPHWMAAKANVLNVNLEIAEVEEAAVLGAAMLAGVGAGVYSSPEEASRNVSFTQRVVVPDKGAAEEYNYLYEKGYRHIYSALKPINRVLSNY